MAEQRPVERAFFREGPDGSTVFFPWGPTRRGYRLPDERARKRAGRAASLLLGSVIAIGGWTAQAIQPVLHGAGTRELTDLIAGPAAALLLVLLAYAGWTSRFCEGLHESDLQVSQEERLREAARLASPGKVATIGAASCALGALLIGLQPRAAWLGWLGIALGVGVLWWSRLLKRVSGTGSSRSLAE